VEGYDFKDLELALDGRGVMTVTLNRPDIHNAFNDELIAELTDCFSRISEDDRVRIVVLTGAGKSFCAGADLNWMKRMVDYDREENLKDATALASMLETIDTCPKPVVGRINGSAIGGGCGLVSVCDIVVASEKAKFGFSEVKLGIAPATICPYVLRKIGPRNTRELFLTGERFDAGRGLVVGLVNYVVAPDKLDDVVNQKIDLLLTSGPRACAEVKKLVRKTFGREPADVARFTAEMIADLRVSEEGQEGIGSFLEKRKPSWHPDNKG
jgi:methylglutaconyl-CoA hydratase